MGNSTPAAWLTPDAFVGRIMLSAAEPYPIISSTGYSSFAPASMEVIPWVQQGPVALKNLQVGVSMNASVPQATSQNSSGSEGFTYGYSVNIFSRQDYTANSSNLTQVVSASLGVTGTVSYSSGSQSYGLSWITNTTGGVANFTTTSSDGAWSNFATGAKMLSIPLVTTLTAGEYFIAFQHSSTAATSGSAVTLFSFSKLQQVWPINSVGVLGASGSQAFANPDGQGFGVVSGLTTNTTMAITAISAATQPLIYFNMSNA